jgi:hypothetical protein
MSYQSFPSTEDTTPSINIPTPSTVSVSPISLTVDRSENLPKMPTTNILIDDDQQEEKPLRMLGPLTVGTPRFNGKNAIAFFEAYQDMCAEYRVPNGKMIERIPKYCERQIELWIRTLPAYEQKDWDELVKVVCEEFVGEDIDYQMGSINYL